MISDFSDHLLRVLYVTIVYDGRVYRSRLLPVDTTPSCELSRIGKYRPYTRLNLKVNFTHNRYGKSNNSLIHFIKPTL